MAFLGSRGPQILWQHVQVPNAKYFAGRIVRGIGIMVFAGRLNHLPVTTIRQLPGRMKSVSAMFRKQPLQCKQQGKSCNECQKVNDICGNAVDLSDLRDQV